MGRFGKRPLPHYWSRALGWYAMALVDSLEYFPVDHPKRGTIMGIFERLSRALGRYQEKESGLWFQVLDQGFREGNYLETSGSAMFIYALARDCGSNTWSSLQEPLRNGLTKVWYSGLSRLTIPACIYIPCAMERGSATTATALTNITSARVVSDAQIGVAPFILASLEMERLKDSREEVLYDALIVNNACITEQTVVIGSGDGTFVNPVLHADYSDPDVIRVGRISI